MTEDDDLLAAEYVLGTLPLADRARAEARLRDPAFAAAVQAWEIRLSTLDGEFAEAPAPDLLPRIEARLFPQPPKPQRGGLWAWAASLGASAAVAAWLALVPLPPPLTATLAGEGQSFAATFDGGSILIRRAAGPAPAEGQAHELWLIAGEAAPVSLGLIGEVTRLPASALPEGAILAVSLEPAGGSPTGQPTGPVLALGPLTRG